MHQHLSVSPEYKYLAPDVVAQLPKVLLRHDVTTDNISEELQQLAATGVCYAEVRAAATTQDEVDLLVTAMSQASFPVQLILMAAESSAVASTIELAAGNRGQVVGVALVGEAARDVAKLGEELALLRGNYLPFVVEAGTTDVAATLQDAVVAGADRISGAVQLYEEFSVDLEGIIVGPLAAYVRDREIPLELALSADVATGLVDEVGDHPLPLLQQLGFTCAFAPAGEDLVSELRLLVDAFDYGLEELFNLTLAAMESAFAPIELRNSIVQDVIVPAFQKFADAEDIEDAADADSEESDDEDL